MNRTNEKRQKRNMSSLLNNQTADRLFSYAGLLWYVQPGNDWLVRSPFVKVENTTAMVVRFQEVAREGRARFNTPLFFLQPRIDNYKLVVADCRMHMELGQLPLENWRSYRDRFLAMFLQDEVLRAASEQDQAIMPGMPHVWFSAVNKALLPFWTDNTRQQVAALHGVPVSALSDAHLQQYWESKSVRHQQQILYPQELFLGSTQLQHVQAWLDFRPVLGCPLPNPAWDVLTGMCALSANDDARQDELATALLQAWQSGTCVIAQEYGWLPDKPNVADIFALQTRFRERPTDAAMLYADYLDILQELYPQPNRKQLIADLRAGWLPETFQMLRTMPPNVIDPRQPDQRLEQAICLVQKSLGNTGKAVLPDDVVTALMYPSRPLVASQLPRPFPFRIHGTPSLEGMSWETATQRCDLFTGPGKPEYCPITHRRRGGIVCQDKEV